MWVALSLSIFKSNQVLQKEMATHSSILGWRIPWTEAPAGLQSMGLQRVGHNWATSHTLSSQGSSTPHVSQIHLRFNVSKPDHVISSGTSHDLGFT